MIKRSKEDLVSIEALTQVMERLKSADDDFAPIGRRMDDDYDLWSLQQEEQYAGFAGETSQTKVGFLGRFSSKQAFRRRWATEIEFISPNPRSFSDHVQARLSAADMQVIVRLLEKEGVDRRDDIAKLEKLIQFALLKADERLTNLGIPCLRDHLIWYAAIRGRMAARIMLWQEENGDITFDFKPLDPYHVRFGMGSKGLSWVTYRTYRSSEAIEEEYGQKASNKKGNEVIDYWYMKGGKVINAVGHNKRWLKSPEPMTVKMLPIIYLPVSNMPPISPGSASVGATGATGVSHLHGDSIYAGVRDIYRFENELYSMWASHAKLLWKQPTINYYDEEGQQLTTTAFMAEEVYNLPMNHNLLAPSPVREISPTLVNLVGLVGAMRQRATIPDIEYGELRNFPLSGTAINELQQARDKVFGPLLRALNTFYTQISYHIERQLIDGGLDVDIKGERERKFYQVKVKPVDLKQPHIIKVEFTARTPWTQLETYQIADMAKRQGLPDQFIREFILKLPDPKELGDMEAVEIAEHSPNLLRLRAIRELAKQGRKDEVMTLIMELYGEWQQQQPAEQSPEQPAEIQGVVPQQSVQSVQSPENMMMGGGI